MKIVATKSFAYTLNYIAKLLSVQDMELSKWHVQHEGSLILT